MNNTCLNTIIIGSGSYIPGQVVRNEDFLGHEFYDQDRQKINEATPDVIAKFLKITNIAERRYADDHMVNSDLAFLAAQDALESSGVDPESLDGIYVAHNFGDVRKKNKKTDMVPSLASRVKAKLGILNPGAIAWDIIFGCPGWLQALIIADTQIKAGEAKRILVIGAETISRVCDPHDRDSMIYADGAGAVILEGQWQADKHGVLAKMVRTDAVEQAHLLEMKESYGPHHTGTELYLKMQGRKLYEYALNHVPGVVKDCLDKAGLQLKDVTKVLIHQANEKMDEAILLRVCKLYGMNALPSGIMPMTINKLGNSSVATIPTLYDLIAKGQMPEHSFSSGDVIVFASVGAGMNVNVVVYKVS